jgi:hypothetical protein
MNLYRWLAIVFVILALAACAQMATGQEQAPIPSYPHDNGPDRRGDMMEPAGTIGVSPDRCIEAPMSDDRLRARRQPFTWRHGYASPNKVNDEPAEVNGGSARFE